MLIDDIIMYTYIMWPFAFFFFSMLLQCSKDEFSIERSENNNSESTATNDDKVRFGSAAMSTSINKSNQGTRKTLNWYCRGIYNILMLLLR